MESELGDRVSRNGIPGWEQVIPDLADGRGLSARRNEEAHDGAEKSENLAAFEDAIDVELEHVQVANALFHAVKAGDWRRIDGIHPFHPRYRVVEWQSVGEFLCQASAERVARRKQVD